MRGTYEAFILVKIKDGRQFVCALNRKQRREKSQGQTDTLSDTSSPWESREFHESQVLWN